MTASRPSLLAVLVTMSIAAVLGEARAASAQDLSRYREYTLGASLDAVLSASGAQPLGVKTLSAQPAKLQRLEWFAPYGGGRDGPADPVRSIAFSFIDDRLYEMAITYDRSRTQGLTDADLIEPLSTVYGKALLSDLARTRADDARSDATVAARWRDDAAGVVLYRTLYGGEYQLVVTGTARAAEAKAAIAESARLESADAPRRELEDRQRRADDDQAAKDKTRAVNKAAFKP